MKSAQVDKIKKWHTVISFLIFIGSLLYSIFKTNLNLLENPLSKLGTNSKTSWIWHSTLALLDIIIIFNSFYHVWIGNLKYKNILSLGFLVAGLGLLGVIIFNMSIHPYHNLFAATFFIAYSTSIFYFGFFQIKNDFRIAMSSIVIGLSMYAFPIISYLLVKSFSIPELFYITLSFAWNTIINFSTEWKGFLKRIGF